MKRWPRNTLCLSRRQATALFVGLLPLFDALAHPNDVLPLPQLESFLASLPSSSSSGQKLAAKDRLCTPQADRRADRHGMRARARNAHEQLMMLHFRADLPPPPHGHMTEQHAACMILYLLLEAERHSCDVQCPPKGPQGVRPSHSSGNLVF